MPYARLFPPRNGGMLRSYFLCYELSRYFDLTLLTFQPAHEFRDGAEGYRWNNKIRILSMPLPDPHQGKLRRCYNAVKGRWYQKSIFRSAGSYMLEGYPAISRLLKHETFDFILFEHLYPLGLYKLVQKLNPNAKIILDAHNVDHLLYAQEHDVSSSHKHQRIFQQIKKQELSLYKYADLFLACSNKDRLLLEQLNLNSIRGVTAPNGADTYKNIFREPISTQIPHLLFCGSLDYEPNLDGLQWFAAEIWPLIRAAIPEVRLTIIGRNPQKKLIELLQNYEGIQLLGEVEDVRPYYAAACALIVPLRKGSGTRLKILEAMSLGTPIISTSIGAEGIEIVHGKHLLIADEKQNFATEVVRLLQNASLANMLAKQARQLVENEYCWENVVHRLYMELDIWHTNVQRSM